MRADRGVVFALGIAVAIAGCGRLGFDSAPRRADAAPELTDPPDARADARAIDAAPDAITLAQLGCADGTREGFTDLAAFPTIAGCAATWSGAPSLRTPATGAPCGDRIGACAAPADACAPGWHLCGDAGDPTELSARMASTDCDSAGNSTMSFVAATSHCESPGGDTCGDVAPYACLANQWCAEPVCCGTACTDGQACHDGVFPNDTWVFGNESQGCGALPSTDGVGVLCCS